MPQATGSRVQLALVAESTFGTTPATPQTQLVEFVSFSGDLAPTNLTDASLRSDRQRTSARRGNVAAEGSLDVVLAPDNYDELIEAAMLGTWATNVLKVGTTRKSFAVEQGFTDLAQYRVFNGMVVDSFKLSVPTSNYVTATFGLKGTTATAFSGTSIDATPTAITTKDKFFHEGGTFKEGGSTVGYLSAIEFTLNNQYSANYALGATSVREMTYGMADLKGKVTALFESVAFYNKFIANTDSSIEFTLTAGSPAETLTFFLPKVKYTKGTIPVQNDGPIVVEMEFEAVKDVTEDTILKITRA